MGVVTEVAPEGTGVANGEAAEEAAEETTSEASGKPGRASGMANVKKELVLRRGSKMPSPHRSGFTRSTEVENALSQIKDNVENHGVPFELFVYANDSRARNSAAAKASDLRKRYKKADNWAFVVADSEAEPDRIALWVQYGRS